MCRDQILQCCPNSIDKSSWPTYFFLKGSSDYQKCTCLGYEHIVESVPFSFLVVKCFLYIYQGEVTMQLVHLIPSTILIICIKYSVTSLQDIKYGGTTLCCIYIVILFADVPQTTKMIIHYSTLYVTKNLCSVLLCITSYRLFCDQECKFLVLVIPLWWSWTSYLNKM